MPKVVIQRRNYRSGEPPLLILSPSAKEELMRMKGITSDQYQKLEDDYCEGKHRNDPDLVRLVETMKTNVHAETHIQLVVITIPDDVNWVVQEEDGHECVSEIHRRWF